MRILSFLQSVSALFGYNRKVEKEFLRTIPSAGEKDILQNLSHCSDDHKKRQEGLDCSQTAPDFSEEEF